MRIKTIVIILITMLLTAVIVQNADSVKFTVLFTDVYISKLYMMLIVAVVAFILGWLTGRPNRATRLGGTADTLSEDDKEYIK